MPLWATIIVIGVVTATGAGLLKTQLAISRELGGINATMSSYGDRLDDLEQWQFDRDAELVAYRNGYRERQQRRARRR